MCGVVEWWSGGEVEWWSIIMTVSSDIIRAIEASLAPDGTVEPGAGAGSGPAHYSLAV